ncbi:MAG: Gfo/Idh/MocA family oxidoreductase, partial [Hyphomonadaceae bacterium]|nr:Gfo/Idh/MocA family oxidoreductase [Hyphomonadaceae bacterium]
MDEQKRRSLRSAGYSRRTLLGGAAAAVAWASLPGTALGQQRKRFGPNDRVNVAAIGAGGKGAGNMASLVSQNIVAIADVDFAKVSKDMIDKTGALKKDRVDLKAAYDKAGRFTDYRRMFDAHKDIEAVVIATPDHHHAIVARMAMERGIHVFVQKPLTCTIRESRMLLALAKKYPQLITAMGNQGHSGDDGRRVIELVRGGAIGKVRDVQIWTNRPVWPQGIARGPTQPTPAGLDWDMWLGPADVNWGYNPDYAHFNWRGWVPFGSGALGDMGAHLMDFPVWALEPGLPTRIETRHTLWGGDTDPWDAKRPAELASFPLGSVTHYEFGKAKGGPITMTWYDGGLMPPTPKGLPPGRIMEPVGGVLFIGDKGMLIHDTYGEKPTVIGEEAV